MSQVKPFVAVVDDDDSLCRAIKRLLRSTGLASDTFKTGDDFLDMFDSIPSYRPACIVLDVQMPGSNGIEIQRRLVGSGIPVVFITAHGRDRRSRTGARCRCGSVLAQAV
jgi:FixJ family two-component response regulator